MKMVKVQEVNFLDLQLGDIICEMNGTPILLITELLFSDHDPESVFNKVWKCIHPNHPTVARITHKVTGFIFVEPDEDGDLTYESNVLYMINIACSLGKTWQPAFMLQGQKLVLAGKEVFHGSVLFSTTLYPDFKVSIVPRG